MQHKHKLFPARPVSRIVLLPKVARVLVLSDGTLHPLSLPGLEPLPSNVMGSIRGVISVVLNDDELDLGGFDGEGASDMTVVVVKHKGIVVYRLGHRMTALKVGFIGRLVINPTGNPTPGSNTFPRPLLNLPLCSAAI